MNDSVCNRAKIQPFDICNHMKSIIKSTASSNLCLTKKSFKLCEMQTKIVLSKSVVQYHFSCDFVHLYCVETLIGTIDPRIGKISWQKFDKEKLSLFLSIENYLSELSKHYDFLFVKCKLNWYNYWYYWLKNYSFTAVDKYAEQLFWFLRYPQASKNIITRTGNGSQPDNEMVNEVKPSVNIIFIDSTSRTQFYYGMPKSVEMMQRISSHRKVFDYKLFQSIGSGTTFNLHRLFNAGNTSAKMANEEITQLNSMKFFVHAKKRGYMTMHVTDVCYGKKTMKFQEK